MSLIHNITPDFVPPSRKSLAVQLLPNAYTELKATLQKKLLAIKQVTLTLDSWTSLANCQYIAITTHGITKNWTLEHLLLDICPVTGYKTGEFIKDEVLAVLAEWKLTKIL